MKPWRIILQVRVVVGGDAYIGAGIPLIVPGESPNQALDNLQKALQKLVDGEPKEG